MNYHPHVLIVEDQQIAGELVGSLFKKLGCEVDYAETSEKAINMTDSTHYNLIMMDIKLKKDERGGIETTKIIRLHEDQKHEAHVPIVALTGDSLSTTEAACMQAGMNEFVIKPCNPTIIASLFHRFIDGKSDIKIDRVKLPALEGEIFNSQAYLNGLEKSDDSNSIRKLADNFFNVDLDQTIIKLQDAYKQNNWKDITSIAKDFISLAGYFGLERSNAAARLYIISYSSGEKEFLEAVYEVFLEEIMLVKPTYLEAKELGLI